MADPSLALQGAIVSALKAAPAVAGGRVYDRVPGNPTFPYVTVGEGQTIGDDNSCFEASECIASVDVWSRAVGLPEAKGLFATVRDRLTTEFTLAGFKVTVAEFVTARNLNDPDGITTRVAAEFRYLIDHDT